MASKFQNRMIGTVVLVAIAVIALPALLDGKKKHYEETFAAIPLVPQAGDQATESELIPPVTQPLTTQQTDSAEDITGREPAELAANGSSASASATGSRDLPLVVATPSSPPRATRQPETPTTAVNTPAVQNNTARSSSQSTPPQSQENIPRGQAWVVQLGALKNAAKANEVVAKLRLSGFRAWSVPATPVEGKMTRIFVGPDASKAKLESQLAEMKKVSGLKDGFVKAWNVN
ncbi:MAG: Cell division protein DedD [Candidatus Erwinia impunctatus]|nr:Cell division protein DedD [Culicoides impunctatus]